MENKQINDDNDKKTFNGTLSPNNVKKKTNVLLLINRINLNNIHRVIKYCKGTYNCSGIKL